MTESEPKINLHFERRGTIFLFLALAAVVLASQAFAMAEMPLFGPKRYDRLKGEPTVYTDSFSGCSDRGDAILKITNGDSSATRMKSAEVYVNGVEVAEENEFKQDVAYIEKRIPVRGINELKVVLKSGMQDDPNETNNKDQSFLIINVFGKGCDSAPPVISGLEPADGALLNNLRPRIAANYADEAGGSGIDVGSVRISIDGSDMTASASISASGVNFTPTSPLPDGVHTVTLSLSDLALNSASASWHFSSDTIAPTVKITSYQNNQYVNTPVITLTGTLDDPAASVSVNGKTALVWGGQFSLSGLNLTEGSNTIAVTARDQAGNIGTDSVVINLDKVAPIISIATPAGGSYVKTQIVSVSGIVAETNPDHVWVNNAEASLSNGSFNSSVSLTEGVNTITVRARDKAGNESIATVPLTLDTIAPVIAVAAPVNGAFLNIPTISVSGTLTELHPAGLWVNDAAVSPTGVGFTHDLTLQEGSNAITVKAVDLAGNETTTTVGVTVDTIRPSITITAPESNSYLNSHSVTVTGSIDEPVTSVKVNGYQTLVMPASGSGVSFSISSLPLSEGANTIKVEAWDRADNLQTASIPVTLDTVAPVVQIVSPQPNAYLNTSVITVTGSANEPVIEAKVNGAAAQIAPSAVDYSLSGVALNEGVNTVGVSVRDRAGNTGNGSVTVNLDTIAPVVSINAPVDNAYVNSAAITVSGTVSEVVTLVTVNGVPAVLAGNSYSIGNIALTQGVNSITVAATDRAGNTGTKTQTLTVDTVAPIITISSPVQGSFVNTSAVAVSGSVDEANLESLWVNGALVPAANNSFTVPNVALTQGSNTITVRARDKAGNESTSNVTLTLDTVPPVVTVSSPQGGLLTKTANIAVSGTVNEQVLSVAVNGTSALVSGLTFTVSSYALSEGLNTLNVSAVDRAGNTGSAAVTVTLDTTAPAAPVISALASPSPLPVVTVSGTAERGSLVTLSVQKTGQGTPVILGTAPASAQGSFSFPNITLAEGTNIFTAIAADAVGNTSEVSAPVPVERDTTPPRITVTSPANNSYTNQTTIAVSGTLDEAAELKINGDAVPVDNLAFTHSASLVVGANFIVISAKDLSGNVATVNWVVYLDQTPPSVTITSPADGLLTRTSGVAISGTVSETSTTVTINGTPATVTNKSFSLSNLTLSEGQNTLTALATDRAGNTGTGTNTVFLDTQAPAVTVTAPSEAAAGSSITISTNASDNRGLSVAEVLVNGSTVWSSIVNSELSTQKSFAYSLSPSLAKDSVLTIQARATDTAGNIGIAGSQVRIASGATGPGYLQGEVTMIRRACCWQAQPRTFQPLMDRD